MSRTRMAISTGVYQSFGLLGVRRVVLRVAARVRLVLAASPASAVRSEAMEAGGEAAEGTEAQKNDEDLASHGGSPRLVGGKVSAVGGAEKAPRAVFDHVGEALTLLLVEGVVNPVDRADGGL